MRKMICYLALVIFSAAMIGCTGLRSNPTFSEKPPRKRATAKSQPQERAVSKSRFERNLMKQINVYMGVPYKWGGSTVRGMDCSGFVSVVYKKSVDLALPHNAAQLYGRGKPVAAGRLQIGDLVFFENIESAGVSHVGIYVGESRFAHASTKRGVVISELKQKYYQDRFIGAKRVYYE